MTIDMPAQAARALDRLERAGHEAYIVGGCVRDTLMGRVPGDYDITTAARPEQVIDCFAGERVIPTGIRHGTVTVLLGGMPLEITTFRADGAYTDHRRPDSVEFSQSLTDDLSRRDFTVNAMAYSPARGLIDLYGGRADIGARLIRCVGEPERRFGEDALRMLRAVRFAATLDFAIDDGTLAALDALKGDIEYVARERVFAELNKAVCALEPERAFIAGRALVRLALGVPEGVSGDYDAAVQLMAHVPRVAELRWAALLRGLGAARAREVLLGLRAPMATINRVCAAIDGSVRAIDSRRVSVLWLLNALGPAGLSDALAIARADAVCAGDCARVAELNAAGRVADELAAGGACWSLKTLHINGETLRGMGFSGKAIGAALGALLALVIEGELPNDADALTRRAAGMTGEEHGNG